MVRSMTRNFTSGVLAAGSRHRIAELLVQRVCHECLHTDVTLPQGWGLLPVN